MSGLEEGVLRSSSVKGDISAWSYFSFPRPRTRKEGEGGDTVPMDHGSLSSNL